MTRDLMRVANYFSSLSREYSNYALAIHDVIYETVSSDTRDMLLMALSRIETQGNMAETLRKAIREISNDRT